VERGSEMTHLQDLIHVHHHCRKRRGQGRLFGVGPSGFDRVLPHTHTSSPSLFLPLSRAPSLSLPPSLPPSLSVSHPNPSTPPSPRTIIRIVRPHRGKRHDDGPRLACQSDKIRPVLRPKQGVLGTPGLVDLLGTSREQQHLLAGLQEPEGRHGPAGVRAGAGGGEVRQTCSKGRTIQTRRGQMICTQTHCASPNQPHAQPHPPTNPTPNPNKTVNPRTPP